MKQRNPAPALPFLILAVSLLAAFLFGHYGCASADRATEAELEEVIVRQSEMMRDAAKRFIPDPERREKLLLLIDELEREFDAFNRDFTQYAAELRARFKGFDTPRDTLESGIAVYKKRRRAARDKIMEIHYRMVSLTTAQEWEKLVEHEMKAMDSTYKISTQDTKG